MNSTQAEAAYASLKRTNDLCAEFIKGTPRMLLVRRYMAAKIYSDLNGRDAHTEAFRAEFAQLSAAYAELFNA